LRYFLNEIEISDVAILNNIIFSHAKSSTWKH